MAADCLPGEALNSAHAHCTAFFANRFANRRRPPLTITPALPLPYKSLESVVSAADGARGVRGEGEQPGIVARRRRARLSFALQHRSLRDDASEIHAPKSDWNVRPLFYRDCQHIGRFGGLQFANREMLGFYQSECQLCIYSDQILFREIHSASI